jgi:hypothetical protein
MRAGLYDVKGSTADPLGQGCQHIENTAFFDYTVHMFYSQAVEFDALILRWISTSVGG